MFKKKENRTRASPVSNSIREKVLRNNCGLPLESTYLDGVREISGIDLLNHSLSLIIKINEDFADKFYRYS